MLSSELESIPMCGYGVFVEYKMAEILNVIQAKDRMKYLASCWENMSDMERQPWRDLAVQSILKIWLLGEPVVPPKI